MFSKLCFTAALVAIASAGNDEYVNMQAANTGAAADAAGQADTMSTAAYVTGPSVDAVNASLMRVKDIAANVEGIKSDLSAFTNGIDKTIGDAKTGLAAATAVRKVAMKKSVARAIKKLRAKLATQAALIAAELKGPIKSTSDQTGVINTATEGFKKSLALKNACIKKNTILKGDKCVAPTLSATAAMSKVSHRGWSNTDGRNGGYINNRYISFSKKSADTWLRIMYTDNMRLHGHTSHAMWNIMICDAGGNGCDYCNDPGRLMHWKWSGHQHNWWMNDHHGGTIFGICKSSGNRKLTVGAYQLKIYMNENRYDIYTGHSGQYGSFMVDEVLKL